MAFIFSCSRHYALYTILLPRLSISSMEVGQDRIRFDVIGTKSDPGATVRFNVIRWPGVLSGDLRYL